MKLISLLILGLFSISAFADWHLPRFNHDDERVEGPRVLWNCPSVNRGDMPEEREVEINYNEEGQIVFRPDIFRPGLNPFRALSGLFKKKKSGSDLDECLKTFLSQVPQTVSQYQSSHCQGSQEALCTKASEDVSHDTEKSIKESRFYARYKKDLEPTTSGPSRSEPAVAAKPEKSVSAPPVLNADPNRARTQLLDYMIDRSSAIADLRNYTQQCPELQNSGEYCRWKYNQNSKLLNDLSRMFSEVRNEPVPVATVLHTLECAPDHVQGLNDIEDLLHRLDKKDECAPLANVGDYKIFRKATGRYYHNTGNYLLKKVGDNKYEATVNVNFKSNGGSATPEQMINIVRNCFDAANPHLKGPGGELLNVRVLSSSEVEAQLPRSERPLADTININPNNTAIDAANFHAAIDCPTVTHEMLHHLGLCDEYHEDRTDITPYMTRSRAVEWSCRPVPGGTSIMKDHIAGFNNAVPRTFTCKCVNQACVSAMSGSDAKNLAYQKVLMTNRPNNVLADASMCKTVNLPTTDNLDSPDKAFTNIKLGDGTLSFNYKSLVMENNHFRYTPALVTCQCPPEKAGCANHLKRAAELLATQPAAESCPLHTQMEGTIERAPANAVSAVNGDRFTIVTTPRNSSLLAPNHFNHILSGMCDGPARNYNQCASFAYIAEDSPECKNRPANCTDDNVYYGTEAQ